MKSGKALRALIIFMGLMALFTLVSRAADSLIICRVKTAEAKSGALEHRAEAEGRVEAAREILVWGTEGLPVAELCVSAGDSVSAGDALLRYEEKSVQDALKKARAELGRLESQQLKTVETDMAAALLLRTRAVEDAEKTLDSAKRSKEKKAAKKALTRAQEDLSLAQKEREEKLKQEEMTLRAVALEIEQKRGEADKLSALLRDGCALRAGADGVVSKLSAEAGKEMGREAAACLAESAGGFRLEVKLPREAAKYVSAGDEAQIIKAGEKEARSAEVTSVSPPDADGYARIAVALGEGDYAVGGSVTVKLISKTARYQQCVRASALRGDSSGDYLLVLREKRGVLGDIAVAERVGVTVLDRDGERAAVEGALYDEKIIVDADKPLEAGGRVRPVDA